MSYYMNRLFNTPFFQNKFVLYASLLVVLLSILRHISNSNINAVVLMALIGLVTSYFSKNMIVVLLTSFTTVFVLEMVGSPGVMEGMENNKKKTKDTNQASNAETDDDTKTESKKGDSEGKTHDTDSDSDNTEKNKTNGKDTEKGSLTTNNQKNKKSKQGMATLSPASYDGEDHDSESVHKTKEGNRIDYASTLEQAYDNIETIIGEDGVRGLTDQTKSLMNQQKELMNNMKEMGPLLKSAEGFMEQLTGGGGIKGITEMLKGFATPGGKKNDK